MAEKKWNDETGNWEIDGDPVTYRVAWQTYPAGEHNEMTFTDIDQGYDYYQKMLRSANTFSVTWDHIPW